jgi:hypothetical protein
MNIDELPVLIAANIMDMVMVTTSTSLLMND